MAQSMQRLSTGLRINSASDDAAGLAIASRMTSQARGLDQAVQNANDAIGMVQTADGAVASVTDMLQRMRELSVQAASDTNTLKDRSSLDLEYQALKAEIERVFSNTQWNGDNLLDGSAGTNGLIKFQVGYEADQTISVNLGDLQTVGNVAYSAGIAAGGVFTNDISAMDIDTVAEANTTLTALDVSIAGLDAKRSVLGSALNTLEFAVDSLSNAQQNAQAARSRIADTDYAAETTELARTQIIAQAATAMLSQANQQAMSVMALLK